jgi:hypothetical protein
MQGAIVQSCAALRHGEPKAELAPIAETLSAYRATGTQLFVPLFLSILTEGYLQSGRIPEGVRVMEEALQLIEANFDRFWEAELYRQKGELTLAQSRVQRLASSVRASPKSKVEKP